MEKFNRWLKRSNLNEDHKKESIIEPAEKVTVVDIDENFKIQCKLNLSDSREVKNAISKST
jgi:hypothetical protein